MTHWINDIFPNIWPIELMKYIDVLYMRRYAN